MQGTKSNILKSVDEIETLIIVDRTFEELKNNFSDEIEKLEEVLVIYVPENDLKTLETEIADRWNCFSKKLANPYEYFSSLDDYQKPVKIF